VGTLAGTQVAIPEGTLAGAQAGTLTQMGSQAMHTINKPPSNPSRNSGGEMGSIGMTIISLNWSNTILVLGMMMILVGLMCVALWLRISQKPYIMQVPERYIAAASRIARLPLAGRTFAGRFRIDAAWAAG